MGALTEPRILRSRRINFDVYIPALLLKHDIVKLFNFRLGLPFSEIRLPFERVGKRIPPFRKGLIDLSARFQYHIQDPDWGVGKVFHRVDTVALSRNHLDRNLAIVRRGLGDLPGAEVSVSRLARLQVLREVDPELETDVGGPVGVLARHLGVHYSAAGRHELQVAGTYRAGVAGEIFVVDATLEEVGYCFLAAVGAVWHKQMVSQTQTPCWDGPPLGLDQNARKGRGWEERGGRGRTGLETRHRA